MDAESTTSTAAFEAGSSVTTATETNTVSGEGPKPDEPKKEPERVYELYSWKTKAPEARLVYIKDAPTAEQELAKLEPGPLGFDLEWKPIRWKGGYNRVALVQLASHDTILLIQVIAMQGTLSSSSSRHARHRHLLASQRFRLR